MGRHNKIVGTIGEAKLLTCFLENDFRVFKEFGDLSRIDLILEKDFELFKVQVKTTEEKKGVVKVTNRKMGPGYQFFYSKKDVDLFAVYVINRDVLFFIKSDELCYKEDEHCCLNFRIDHPKNNQLEGVRFAKDYTLDKIF